VLTFEQIKELIEEVAERGLQGWELERAGFRLKIDGKAAPTLLSVVSTPGMEPERPAPPSTAALTPAVGEAPAASPAASAAASGEKPAEKPDDHHHVLASPIVGTFYRRPSPEADSFVEVGGRVRKGQVLCIVEAMKLMNEIESDVDGVIQEVFPQNAQPVEFGEPLFAIRVE